MGNTLEIEVWKFDKSINYYKWQEYWRGESWIAAVWNLIKAKREGHGCVTLHWR